MRKADWDEIKDRYNKAVLEGTQDAFIQKCEEKNKLKPAINLARICFSTKTSILTFKQHSNNLQAWSSGRSAEGRAVKDSNDML